MTNAAALLDRPPLWRVAADVVIAVAIGIFVYGISCQLVEPATAAKGFGLQWQGMAEDPFALFGQFPHRVLAPFLAWLVGFGSDGWLEFTQVLHVALLASVFFVVLRLGGLLIDALLATIAVAITAPIQIYKLHWVGYTDPICYTLFLWMIVASRSPYVMWSLLLVNLLNHELAAFLVPWLWFLRRQHDSRWGVDGACLCAVMAIYGVYYLCVKGSANQTYSVDYFVANPLFPGGSIVVWNLAAVHWTCAFGPILAVLAWHQHSKSQRGERWHLWLIALGIFVIHCIAWDWMRHANLIVLALVISITRFLGVGNIHRWIFAGLLVLTTCWFWLVPPWASTAWPTSELIEGPPAWRELHPKPESFILETGIVVPSAKGVGFGPVSAVFENWLPWIWKLLLAIHLAGLAIWGAGWVLARREDRALH